MGLRYVEVCPNVVTDNKVKNMVKNTPQPPIGGASFVFILVVDFIGCYSCFVFKTPQPPEGGELRGCYLVYFQNLHFIFIVPRRQFISYF
jgi:hypothetical protein